MDEQDTKNFLELVEPFSADPEQSAKRSSPFLLEHSPLKRLFATPSGPSNSSNQYTRFTQLIRDVPGWSPSMETPLKAIDTPFKPIDTPHLGSLDHDSTLPPTPTVNHGSLLLNDTESIKREGVLSEQMLSLLAKTPVFPKATKRLKKRRASYVPAVTEGYFDNAFGKTPRISLKKRQRRRKKKYQIKDLAGSTLPPIPEDLGENHFPGGTSPLLLQSPGNVGPQSAASGSVRGSSPQLIWPSARKDTVKKSIQPTVTMQHRAGKNLLMAFQNVKNNIDPVEQVTRPELCSPIIVQSPLVGYIYISFISLTKFKTPAVKREFNKVTFDLDGETFLRPYPLAKTPLAFKSVSERFRSIGIDGTPSLSLHQLRQGRESFVNNERASENDNYISSTLQQKNTKDDQIAAASRIDPQQQSFTTFSTAGGRKAIVLSEAAKAKARMYLTLDDDDSLAANVSPDFNTPGFTTAREKRMLAPADSPMRLVKKNLTPTLAIEHKSYGAVKLTPFSESAITESFSLPQFADDRRVDSSKAINSDSILGVAIHNDLWSIMKTRAESDIPNPNPMPMSLGFSTASNKQVKPLSNRARASALALLEMADVNDDLPPQSEPEFSTPAPKNFVKRGESTENIRNRSLPQTQPETQQKEFRLTKQQSSRKKFTTPFKNPDYLRVAFAGIKTESVEKVAKSELFNLKSMESPRPKWSNVFGKPANHLDFGDSELYLRHGILEINGANAEQYCFVLSNSSEVWGAKEARDFLLGRGALESIASLEWVTNHYKWIVWKLSSLVKRFSNSASTIWTVARVQSQLAYRYEREVNCVQRPALRLIIEQDTIPSKLMVSKRQDVLELSDGWYKIPVCLDEPLKKELALKRLFIGQKLCICNAEFRNHAQPVAALECDRKPRLGLHFNSTRIGKWDLRLGFLKRRPFAISISKIHPEGGRISAIDVIVTRKYPPVYFEKRKGERSRIMTAIEKFEVEQEYHKQRESVAAKILDNLSIDSFQTQGDFDRKYEEAMAEVNNKVPPRDFSMFIKFELCDYPAMPASCPNTICELTVWSPDSEILETIQEGKRYQFFGLDVHPVNKKTYSKRQCKASLKAQRNILHFGLPTDDNVMIKSAYQPRRFSSCRECAYVEVDDQADIVAVVLDIKYSHGSEAHPFLILSDKSRAFMCVQITRRLGDISVGT
ncbi:hypothetical protein HDU97_009179 [Phlyctochytrium planicorne]|nr:hypothetical protein HDU97_009179 [Phlyctochytrium planicorne]